MCEMETRDRDGNWYLLRITPSRDERDQVEGAILTLVDIGNRKRAEEEREHLLATIRGERAQLEMVIQCMPSAVIVAEAPSGKIILANGQVQRVFGGPRLRWETRWTEFMCKDFTRTAPHIDRRNGR